MNGWTLNIEGGSITIENPSWEQIQEAIQSMDGWQVTEVEISYDGSKIVLSIGGGVEIDGMKRYAVMFMIDPENEDIFGTFTRPDGDPSVTHTIPVEKIATDFPDNMLLDYESALSIAKYVYENKQLPPDWEWE